MKPLFEEIQSLIDAEKGCYNAIRRLPRVERPLDTFFRGKTILCSVFGVWKAAIVVEVRHDKDSTQPALKICVKAGMHTICEKCDVSCQDCYPAVGDWGGLLTKEELE